MSDGVKKSKQALILELEEARRRLAEQSLQSRAEKTAALERLAGGVAHDVNNALTSIAGYTSVLLRGLEPDAPAYEDLEAIRRAAARIRVLTRQLQAFARRQMLQSQEADLNDLIKNLAPQLREAVGEEVTLDFNLALDLGHARFDPEQLAWALAGLAQNAREATPPGGRITLETANVELLDECGCQCGAMVCGPHVMLAVRDTGAGMDEETLAHAFEPFFTTKGRRAGMGLPVAYGIATLSGGHVAVESELGRGTTVRIYLPRVSVDTATQPTSPARPSVLLVDDEEDVRRLAARLLARDGYEVLEAPDGETALALLRQREGIDLLVTDVGLPGSFDGRALAAQLTAQFPGLKVLFISGSLRDDTALAPGVTLVEKPFTPDELLAAVRKLLGAG